jgi:hypothetical protein
MRHLSARGEEMQQKFIAEVGVNKSWSMASAAMLMGGIAFRRSWELGVFYKIEEGLGLVRAYKGTILQQGGGPTKEDMAASDWTTITPASGECLTVQGREAQVQEIGAITFVPQRDDAADAAAFAQQVDVAAPAYEVTGDADDEVDVTTGLTFPEMLTQVLNGSSQAWRPGGVECITLVEMPAVNDRAVVIVREDGSLVPYAASPDDLTARDWVICYGEAA